MSDDKDKIWTAFLAKYDRVYNPAASDLAVAEQAALEARRLAGKVVFPPQPKPRTRHW